MTGLNSARSNVENMVLGKNFLEQAGSLKQAQETLTQVASTQTVNPNQPVANDAFTRQNTGSTCASGACPFHQT